MAEYGEVKVNFHMTAESQAFMEKMQEAMLHYKGEPLVLSAQKAEQLAQQALEDGLAKQVSFVMPPVGSPEQLAQLLFDGKLVAYIDGKGTSQLGKLAEPSWLTTHVDSMDVGPLKLGPSKMQIGPVGSMPPDNKHGYWSDGSGLCKKCHHAASNPIHQGYPWVGLVNTPKPNHPFVSSDGDKFCDFCGHTAGAAIHVMPLDPEAIPFGKAVSVSGHSKGMAVDWGASVEQWKANWPNLEPVKVISAEFHQGNVGAMWIYEMTGTPKQVKALVNALGHDVIELQGHGGATPAIGYHSYQHWTMKTSKPVDPGLFGLEDMSAKNTALLKLNQLDKVKPMQHAIHLSDPVGHLNVNCIDCYPPSLWDEKVKQIMVSYHVQLDRLAPDLTPEQRVRVLAAFHSAAYVDIVKT